MKRYHEEITSFDPDGETPEEQIKTDISTFNEIMAEAGNMQVVIISIIGPYQVGKSSLISMLTRDAEIEEGNSADETTEGADIYGPYLFNDIRANFGLESLSKDILVYFFDTEGICGQRIENNPTLNRLLLTEILSPYVALSHITIIMHPANIGCNETEYLLYFLGRAKEFTDGDELELITVIQDFGFIKTNESGEKIELKKQYENACKTLSELIPPKFNGKKTKKYIALSHYDKGAKPLDQTPLFKNRFRLAALDIIDSMEKAITLSINDGQSVITQFQRIIESTKNNDFLNIIRAARKESQFDTSQRIYLPSINRLIDIKKAEIAKLYPVISINSSDEDRLRFKEIKVDSLIPSIEAELNKFEIPHSIKQEAIEKFSAHIISELDEFIRTKNIIYEKELLERQIDYLNTKVAIEIDNITSEAMIDVIGSESTKYDKKIVEKHISKIESRLNNAIEKHAKCFDISVDAKNAVQCNIERNKKAIIDKIVEYAKQVANENKAAKKGEWIQRIDNFLNAVGALGGLYLSLSKKSENVQENSIRPEAHTYSSLYPNSPIQTMPGTIPNLEKLGNNT